jgi:hypothetical protein
MGVLTIFTDRKRVFDNDEKRLCSALASLGAVALQNSRLYARVFMSEESLRKNERLTTLGLLAAEIAHEIRNPLTVLKLLHGGLGLDFAEGDPRRTDMRVIGEKLDQLEAIVTPRPQLSRRRRRACTRATRWPRSSRTRSSSSGSSSRRARSRSRSSRRPAGRRRGPQGPAAAGAAQPPHQLHAGHAGRRRDHDPARAEAGRPRDAPSWTSRTRARASPTPSAGGSSTRS